MRIAVLFILAIGVLAGAGLAAKRYLGTEPPPDFRMATVKRGDLLMTIGATGTLEPEELVDVGAQVVGRIKEFGLDPDKTGATKPGADKPDATQSLASRMQANKPSAVPPTANKPTTDESGKANPTAGQTAVRRSAPAENNAGRPPKKPKNTIDYGSVVHEGTILAHIDDALYKAQVDQATAALSQAQAALERAEADKRQQQAKQQQAEQEWSRAKELRSLTLTGTATSGIKAISDSDYDLTVANLATSQASVAVSDAAIKQAQAAIEQAKASLELAETNLGYTVIKSPVEGVIIDRRVNIGQTVVASLNAPSLFLIARDLRQMQVWASVNEADIGRIHRGQAVRFTVDAYRGETFHGTVGQIRLNATMTQNVVTYTVVVDTDNSDLRLLPYLTANLLFEVAEHQNVLLVPNAALRWPQAGRRTRTGEARETARGSRSSVGQGRAVRPAARSPDRRYRRIADGGQRRGTGGRAGGGAGGSTRRPRQRRHEQSLCAEAIPNAAEAAAVRRPRRSRRGAAANRCEMAANRATTDVRHAATAETASWT
jgi:HlyD family secretion protein